MYMELANKCNIANKLCLLCELLKTEAIDIYIHIYSCRNIWVSEYWCTGI